MSEVWRAVPGFEGLYEVSDLGRVRSLDRVILANWRGVVVRRRLSGKMQKFAKHRNGYQLIHLWKENKRHVDTVHAVVLAAFVGPRPVGKEGCHENGVRDDNRLLNLRYDTRPGNHADKVRHGTHNRGVQHRLAILTAEQVRTLQTKRAGVSLDDLVAEFGLSRDHLRKVRSGERRVHG